MRSKKFPVLLFVFLLLCVLMRIEYSGLLIIPILIIACYLLIRKTKKEDDKHESLNDLGVLISLVMAADSRPTNDEYHAACNYLEKLSPADYRQITNSIDRVDFDQVRLIECANGVARMYNRNTSSLYFVMELLYEVAICDGGITASEWLCLCNVLDIFFPNTDDDFLYFIEKYSAYETEPRPEFSRFSKILDAKGKKSKQQNREGATGNGTYQYGNFSHDQQSKTNLVRENKYYACLGLKSDATKEEILKAYHSLAKRYHPDTTQIESEKAFLENKFKEIQEAYDMLKD